MGGGRQAGRGTLVVAGAAILAAGWVIYANAWLCDDIFIPLRCIDNLLQGHGLRWNVAERVQVFTCPLWTLLLAGFVALTRESYLTTVAASALFTLAAFLFLLARFLVPRGAWAVAGFSSLLLLSKSFVDFSVSGLETPLAVLLLVLFLAVALRGERKRGDLGRLTLLASLLILCHPDLILILLPSLAWAAWRTPREERPLLQAAAGILPFLGWEGFSLLYYGTFLPNPVLGKFNSHLPLWFTVRQGGFYFLESLLHDPLTLLTVGAGTAAALAGRKKELVLVAAGVAAYLVFVLAIGGDFMGGRFFAVPFAAAVVILASSVPLATRSGAALLAGVALVGFLSPHPPPLSGPDYFGRGALSETKGGWRGIADERGFWYRAFGLRKVLAREDRGFYDPEILEADPPLPGVRTMRVMQAFVARGERVIDFCGGGAGILGFTLGPHAHLMDTLGVCDPLLARIPFRHDPGKGLSYRPGHLIRRAPEGYGESVRAGVNLIRDPEAARLYDRVLLMTSAPLFSGERWRAIACSFGVQ